MKQALLIAMSLMIGNVVLAKTCPMASRLGDSSGVQPKAATVENRPSTNNQGHK